MLIREAIGRINPVDWKTDITTLGIFCEQPAAAMLMTVPSREEWYNPRLRLHDWPHHARVFVHAARLAGIYRQDHSTLDVAAINASTLTHDAQRVDDDRDDFDHGWRAADWFVRQKKAVDFDLSPQSLLTVKHLLTMHSLFDLPNATLELKILKDSDALDRFRGTNDFDQRFLRLPESQLLINPARELWRRTQFVNGHNQFAQVLSAAVDMGLIK